MVASCCLLCAAPLKNTNTHICVAYMRPCARKRKGVISLHGYIVSHRCLKASWATTTCVPECPTLECTTKKTWTTRLQIGSQTNRLVYLRCFHTTHGVRCPHALSKILWTQMFRIEGHWIRTHWIHRLLGELGGSALCFTHEAAWLCFEHPHPSVNPGASPGGAPDCSVG